LTCFFLSFLLDHESSKCGLCLHNLREKQPLLVHVGKAGGGTIRATMAQLYNVTFGDINQIHLDRGLTKAEALDDRMKIIPLRDPIQRVVSAFNWRHPDGGGFGWDQWDLKSGDWSGRSSEFELYSCFESVDAFAKALTEYHTYCGFVARRSLVEPVGHIGTGYGFYFRHVIPLIPMMKYTIVNISRMEIDLKGIFPSLEQIVTIHAEYPRRHQTFLSEQASSNLASFLCDEYYILNQLTKPSLRV